MVEAAAHAVTDELTHEIAAITRAIADDGVEGALDRVVGLAVRTIGHCADASVTSSAADGTPVTVAQTSDEVLDADGRQYEHNEGPCLDAVRRELRVYSPDLLGDRRWPRLVAAMKTTPYRGVLSYRLVAPDQRETLGSLNLYATDRDPFAPEAQHIGLLLAVQAAMAMVAAESSADQRRTESNLLDAVETRDIIGQAKGILMERHKVGADAAFDMLRATSQRLNIKLRTVAQELAETGALPGSDPPGRPTAPL